MSQAVRSMRWRRRILRASFPPPGSWAWGAALVAIGAAGLASWSYADPALPWSWCGNAVMAAVFLGLVASQLVASDFEPLVAALARELGDVPGAEGGVSGRGGLSRRERRRVAAARLDPARSSVVALLALLPGVGFLVAWLVQTPSPRATVMLLGLLGIVTMVFGYALIEYLRWQPLIAALRNDLGAERLAVMLGRSEGPQRGAALRLTPAQLEAVRRARPGAHPFPLITALGLVVCAVEIFLAWLAWRSEAGIGLFLLACAGIAVAGCLTGYAAAGARWQPLVAALRPELGPKRHGPEPSVPDGHDLGSGDDRDPSA